MTRPARLRPEASTTEGGPTAPSAHIAQSILMLRGHRVLMDRDLAAIYGAATKRLNEAVKRNAKRFPEDFMFQLTDEESEHLRSHFATSSWGGRRYRPYAFTEHGAIQATNVLNSPRAIEMSIFVVRAFVKLRELMASNKASPDWLYGGFRKQALVAQLGSSLEPPHCPCA